MKVSTRSGGKATPTATGVGSAPPPSFSLRSSPQTPPKTPKLAFAYNDTRDILTIEALAYSGSFFRSLAFGGPGSRFEIISRRDDALTLKSLHTPVVEAACGCCVCPDHAPQFSGWRQK